MANIENKVFTPSTGKCRLSAFVAVFTILKLLIKVSISYQIVILKFCLIALVFIFLGKWEIGMDL